MEIELCMNCSHKNSTNCQWKKGWPLSSGGFARLCDDCGSAYADSTFCEKFHQHQSGWMKCNRCSKFIHCGCIVSRPLYEYLDFGGISCVSCIMVPQLLLARRLGPENSNGSTSSIQKKATKRGGSDHTGGKRMVNGAGRGKGKATGGRPMVDGAGKGKAKLSDRIVETGEPRLWPQAQRDSLASSSSIGPNMQGNRRFSNAIKPANHLLSFPTLQNSSPTWETGSMQRALTDMSLGTLTRNFILPSAASECIQGILEAFSSPYLQAQRPLPMFPTSLRTGIIMNPKLNSTAPQPPNQGITYQPRVARPPADRRARNLLLSRYWPKMTDRELEQLSKDLKSAVVPLFEKVLSVSDASRIGRLVIPKSCAEAYFPPIPQSGGLPLQILDASGNEWRFNFRFWPNNNSRMYILEGVTSCLHSFLLSPGDIVTFCRTSPGSKFVLGYRRAPVPIDTQDASASTSASASASSASPHSDNLSTKEATPFGANANQNQGNTVSNLLRKSKGKGKLYSDGRSEQWPLGAGTADCPQTGNSEIVNNDLLRQPISGSKATTQNFGPSRFHDEDSTELTVTWEEAMELLCPPPKVEPSIETIEDQEFEEYEEPPVFGRRTTDDANSSGLNGALKLLENMLMANKARRLKEKPDPTQESSVGLNELATLATLSEDANPANSSVGPTSKHPRHRAGCTCIVCIQPSSGKGKHKQTCTCVACMTVKRRCNTMMMRKRKRGPQRGKARNNDEGSMNSGGLEVDGEPGAGQLDLNFDPNDHDEDPDMHVDA